MLEEQIKNDLKQAQLSKDELKVSTLRMLLSEMTYLKVSKGGSDQLLGDLEIITVVQKEIKKRREAAEGFRKGGREDSASKEESEISILQTFLPEQLTPEELTKVVEEAITKVRAENNTGTSSIQDMGKVMSEVMSKVSGRAEGSTISILIRERLLKA